MKTLSRYSWLLPLISGAMVITCLIYCRLWWTPHPMTLGDVDESIMCWMFCSTMNNFWFSLGLLFGLSSIAGGVMLRSGMKPGPIVALTSGILILPIGLLNFITLFVKVR